MGCELTAIVWIARPYVAHCVVEMILKFLNVISTKSLPFYVIKMHYAHEGVVLKKDVFRVSKQ